MIVCNSYHCNTHAFSIKRMCGMIFIIFNIFVYFRDNVFTLNQSHLFIDCHLSYSAMEEKKISRDKHLK